MKKIWCLFIICLLITGCGYNYQTIDSNRAMELINEEEAIVIDVRNADEFSTGHIAGAVNIPLNNIESISYDKNTKIILYCASGIRSLEAAKKLDAIGYTNLYNLDGGILNWGFDLEE